VVTKAGYVTLMRIVFVAHIDTGSHRLDPIQNLVPVNTYVKKMSISISYIFQLGNTIDTHQSTDMD